MLAKHEGQTAVADLTLQEQKHAEQLLAGGSTSGADMDLLWHTRDSLRTGITTLHEIDVAGEAKVCCRRALSCYSAPWLGLHAAPAHCLSKQDVCC